MFCIGEVLCLSSLVEKKSLNQVSCLCHGQCDTVSISEGFIRHVSSKFIIYQHIASFVPLEYMHELLCIFDLRPGYFPHIFSPIRREVSVAGWPLPPKVLNCLNFLPLSPVQAVVCYP